MEQNDLFRDYKYCELCGKPLALSYKESLCPFCKDQKLFHSVREYIRANDVTEYDVSEHFQIPLQRIKKWIKDGRIEYREQAQASSIMSTHCQHCGAPVTFGTLCPKCLRLMNSGHGTAATFESSTKMHYLDIDSKSRK